MSQSENTEQPQAAPGFAPANEPEAPTEPSLIEASAALVESVVDYVRQETGDLVHDKVAVPIQKAGGTAALAIGIAVVLVTGIWFISAGVLVLIAAWIGWPAALLAVGGLLVTVSAVLALVRTRSMQ